VPLDQLGGALPGASRSDGLGRLPDHSRRAAVAAWCEEASGNSEQKQHRCGSRCYRASPGEIHGCPLPRDSRWKIFMGDCVRNESRGDLSPVSIERRITIFSGLFRRLAAPTRPGSACGRGGLQLAPPKRAHAFAIMRVNGSLRWRSRSPPPATACDPAPPSAHQPSAACRAPAPAS